MNSAPVIRLAAVLAVFIASGVFAKQPSPALTTPTAQTRPTEGETMPAETEPLMRWALQQGALATIVLIVFWTYRRDTQANAKKSDEKIEVLTSLVGQTAAAIATQTAQSAATEKSLDRLSNALETRKL